MVFPGGTSATNPNITRNFGSVVFPGRFALDAGSARGRDPVLRRVHPRSAATLHSINGNNFSRGGNSFRQPGRRGGRERRNGRRVRLSGVTSAAAMTITYGMPPPERPGAATAPQQPNVTVVYPPQQQQRARSMIQIGPDGDYTSAAPGAQQSTSTTRTAMHAGTATPHYLIAFKDHTIYSAVAYWVDGDTLHYFTTGNTHNQASVSLIDRDLPSA